MVAIGTTMNTSCSAAAAASTLLLHFNFAHPAAAQTRREMASLQFSIGEQHSKVATGKCHYTPSCFALQ